MAGGSSSHEELNLVPYLDIVTTLMIALVAIASFSQVNLHRADVVAAHLDPPDADTPAPAPGAQAAREPEPVTIAVRTDGFVLDGGDGSRARLNAGADVLPFALLRTVLRRLHDQPGAPTRAVVTADAEVP
jgi:biopolymer transport protein ExbD